MSVTNRRAILSGGLAGTFLLLAAPGTLAQTSGLVMKTYRSPSCGCCHKWVEIAEKSGFTVEVVNTDDILAVKKRLSVPDALFSCHTSQLGPYVIEGHVPMEAMKKLLRERPAGTAGIGLAGMPRGSPGMETANGQIDPIHIQAWDRQGRLRSFN